MHSLGSNYIFVIVSGCLFILIGFLINKFTYKKAGEGKRQVFNKVLVNKTNLSKQEHKVFILMADGLSNIEIAGILYISESTVKPMFREFWLS